jgi:ATP synthase F1 epsilon subunit
MKLELITLSGAKVDDEVYEVLIPTPDGVIAVMPGHERMVTLASHGIITIRRHKSDPDELLEYYATYGGVVEISPALLKILVDEADSAESIIHEEAESALKEALEMRAHAGDQIELEKARELIDRHTVRLKLATLRRRHQA